MRMCALNRIRTAIGLPIAVRLRTTRRARSLLRAAPPKRHKPAEVSTSRLSARYTATSDRDDVVVAQAHVGRWQVLEVAGSRVTIVDTMTSHDDRLEQAEAGAREKAA